MQKHNPSLDCCYYSNWVATCFWPNHSVPWLGDRGTVAHEHWLLERQWWYIQVCQHQLQTQFRLLSCCRCIEINTNSLDAILQGLTQTESLHVLIQAAQVHAATGPDSSVWFFNDWLGQIEQFVCVCMCVCMFVRAVCAGKIYIIFRGKWGETSYQTVTWD